MDTEEILIRIFDRYKFTEEDKERFLDIISPIICHKEFIKRMDNRLYPHHGPTSLGEHIISDAAVAFKLTENKEYIDQELAVIIALFHDLYEKPWQNAGIIKNSFFNKHGFTHPIEAAVNAATWYSDYFKETKRAEIIIDGIIHHMFPFPVRALNGSNAELNNDKKFNELPPKIRNMIILSSLRNRIGKISLARSKYYEGRVVARSDKMVAFSKDFTISGSIACVTGVNKKLEKKIDKENKKR